MKSHQQGISTTNLLVILAILIVLAAVAVPAWRTHTARTHVTDATKAVDAAKLAVMEAATVHGGLDRIKTADLPTLKAATLASPYAADVKIADGGSITLVTRNTGGGPDPVLVFVPHDSKQAGAAITWTCVIATGDASLAPPSCQPATAGADAQSAAPAGTATAVPATAASAPR